MNIHFYHHVIFEPSETEINQYNILTTKLNQIMGITEDLKAKTEELSAKVDELQVKVDAEQEQIAALLATNAQVVSDLNAQVVDLQGQLSASVGAEAATEVINNLQVTIDKLATTEADLEGTV